MGALEFMGEAASNGKISRATILIVILSTTHVGLAIKRMAANFLALPKSSV